jgi:hypothetical protein
MPDANQALGSVRMDDQPASDRIEIAARALAADLEHSVPTTLDGEDGWRAVAERALAAADSVS